MHPRGWKFLIPPEYEAARTVLVRNVDQSISDLEADAIKTSINSRFLEAGRSPVKRVIKIPNSSHLLKIVFNETGDADKTVREGFKIYFQFFQGKNIEKELFVPIVPCYRCYSYTHQKKACPKPEGYKVCSNCSEEGHLYTECNSETNKCINCNNDHRTLAARCPKRKELIRSKVREIRERSKSRNRPDTIETTTRDMLKLKLPENYLTVMAATITLADKRETEVPGTFQYICDEILKANGIPLVKFPDTVVNQQTLKGRREKDKERVKKRMGGWSWIELQDQGRR